MLNLICTYLALSESINHEKIVSFCESIRLHQEILNIPDGYNSFIGDSGIKVSGGQRQLIGFIRALYKNPDVLLIDEGTSSMDPELESKIQYVLKCFFPQLAIIVATHGAEWDSAATKTIRL